MDYNTFKEKLRELVEEALGPEYVVFLREVPQNNGISQDMLMICEAEKPQYRLSA